MRKPLRRSFAELVKENKRELLEDKKAMERIEARLDEKRVAKTN